MLQYAMSYRGVLSHIVRDRAVSSRTDMSCDRQTEPHHAVPCRAAPYSTEPDIPSRAEPNQAELNQAVPCQTVANHPAPRTNRTAQARQQDKLSRQPRLCRTMLCRQVLVVFLASARAWKCPQVGELASAAEPRPAFDRSKEACTRDSS